MYARPEMIRALTAGDEERLDAFLRPHTDTSMFLRANLRAGGIVDRGEALQGTYVGAFRDGALIGVAAHWWNGMVSVQAPDALDAVVAEAVRCSGREVGGVSGPLEQVRRAQQVLGLGSRTANLDSVDVLYALELKDLRVPDRLATGAVRVRVATRADEPLLVDWHHDYSVETLGDTPGPALRARVTGWVRRYLELGVLFLAEDAGAPVSTAAFNASLPECVQVGGVWTPVALRSRGYARIVTAGALRHAASRGVTRSVLFTDETNAPARRAYEALGYVDAGRFALVLYDLS